MSKRVRLLLGIVVCAFAVAASISSSAGVGAQATALPAASMDQGRSQGTSTAAPHKVDVGRLPAAASTAHDAGRLPLFMRDPAAYAAAKKSPTGSAGTAITPAATAQPGAGPVQTSNVNTSFPRINSAQDARCCEPPDTQMAAGPTRGLEMVNHIGKIYDKTGAAIATSFALSH